MTKKIKKCRRALITVFLFTVLISQTVFGAAQEKTVKIPAKSAYVINLNNSTNKTVKWSVSSKKVASIVFKDNTKAIVQTNSKGVATITAKIGKTKYTYKIKSYEPKSLPKKITLIKGMKYTFVSKQRADWGVVGNHVLRARKSYPKKFKVLAVDGGDTEIRCTINGKTVKCIATVIDKTGSKINTYETNLKKEREEIEAERQRKVDPSIGDYGVVELENGEFWIRLP